MERDYVLGTHDAEVERLGLQHRVWAATAAAAWDRAGIGRGMSVLDAGAGPGWAARDLAQRVGPAGHVLAVERSARFAATARDQLAAHAHAQVLEADLADADLPAGAFDAVWIRWVLSFVTDPRGVLARLIAALKPGGVLVAHEYLQYRTWTVLPPQPALAAFAERVEDSVAAGGGQMDVGRHLIGWTASLGATVEHAAPLIEIVERASPVWTWPASFVRVNTQQQVDAGASTPAQADATRAALAAAETDPHARMVTPLMLELIARKPA